MNRYTFNIGRQTFAEFLYQFVTPLAEFNGEHRLEAIASGWEKIDELNKMTVEEARQIAIDTADKLKVQYQHDKERIDLILYKYNTMIDQVLAWKAPAEFDDLRNYMLRQLEEGKKWDCWQSDTWLPEPDGAAWIADNKRIFLESIESQYKYYGADLKAYNERAAYLKKLEELVGPRP